MTKISKYTRAVTIVIMLLMVFMLTACSDEVESAVIPMDSIAQNIAEPGVFGYMSSLKTHYKNSQKEGDIGTITMTLSSDTDYFYTSPWWVDEYRQRVTADIMVIAGDMGDTYRGSVVCHKCEHCTIIEGVLDGETIVETIKCDCDGNNSYYGLVKILTVVIITLE